MSDSIHTGSNGEELVSRRLTDQGWTVLARNWRTRHGELDIIALDGDVLVAVEVKTRRSLSAGVPLEAITPRKVARLRRLLVAWLHQQDASFGAIRVDAVGVWLRDDAPDEVEHLRGIE